MKCALYNNEVSFFPNDILPEHCIEIDISNFDDYIELINGYNDRKYIIEDNVMVLNPNWEEEKKERERERISHLKCTKRVLALMLQELGITYTALKELIASNEQAQLEWDLCVELERCNPLLDVMGSQLGLTPAQIDQMFKYANGEVESLEVE